MNKTQSHLLNKPIRWGIIGCGDVTEIKSGPAYQQTDGFELFAVMRRNAKLAADYAKRHGIAKHGSDADQLIHDASIDAIYIATPPDSHLEYALKVAAAGKICCIEKPMAVTYEACLQIQSAFEKAKVPCFVAYYRRSLPRFVQVKQWLDQGEIGQVRNVIWQCHKPPSKLDKSKTPNWRTDANIAPAGYFDDLACHGLDLLHYFLGDFETVKGHSTNQQNLYTACDAVTASWIHTNGITGCASWNFASYEHIDSVTITGSKGIIKFSVFKDDIIELHNQNGLQALTIAHPKHVQLPHVQAMAKQLFDGITHPSNTINGAHIAWVMDAILGKLNN